MKITAVRHGDTIENAARIVQGQTFGTLSPLGLQQIEELGFKLQDHAFEKAYISDLDRCVKTGAAILKFHTAKPFIYDERLRERSMKPDEGLPFNEFAWGGGKSLDLTAKTAEGETWLEVRDRLVSFIDFLLVQPEQDVLLVTHGGPIRVLDAILTDQSIEESLMNNYDNCTVRVWEV
jgi:probable phosphoglycerate mutase